MLEYYYDKSEQLNLLTEESTENNTKLLDARIWIPTESVSCAVVELPQASRNVALKTIPFMLEDMVLEPVESIHFSHGSVKHDKTPVVFLKRQIMESLIDECENSGVFVWQIVPDFFVLPWREKEVHVLVEKGRILVRLDEAKGLAGAEDILWPVIQKYIEANKSKLFVYGISNKNLPKGLSAEKAIEKRTLKDFILTVGSAERGINLLRGDFSPNSGLLKSLQKYRPLLVAGILFWVVVNAHLLLRYQEEKQENAFLQEQLQSQVALLDPAFSNARLNRNLVESYTTRLAADLEQKKESNWALWRDLQAGLQICPSCAIKRLEIDPKGVSLSLESYRSLDKFADNIVNRPEAEISVQSKDANAGKKESEKMYGLSLQARRGDE